MGHYFFDRQYVTQKKRHLIHIRIFEFTNSEFQNTNISKIAHVFKNTNTDAKRFTDSNDNKESTYL